MVWQQVFGKNRSQELSGIKYLLRNLDLRSFTFTFKSTKQRGSDQLQFLFHGGRSVTVRHLMASVELLEPNIAKPQFGSAVDSVYCGISSSVEWLKIRTFQYVQDKQSKSWKVRTSIRL